MNDEFPLPLTAKNIALATEFAFEKWRERARGLGRGEPEDLSGACKFCSLFAQAVFGGQLRGNWHHQFVVHGAGQIIDLCAGAKELAALPVSPYRHDPTFWGNPEHLESLASCSPRVARWVEEFRRRVMDVKPADMPSGLSYGAAS